MIARTVRCARCSVLGCITVMLASLVITMGASGAAAQSVSGGDSSGRGAAAVRDTTSARATDSSSTSARSPGDPPFFGVWAAASRHASFKTRLGTRYHDFYLVGLRAGWTVARGTNVSLDYVLNAIPVARMVGNPEYQYIATNAPCPVGEFCQTRQDFRLAPSYHSVYGFGLAPLGVQMRLFTHSPVQLLVHVNGGALWFTQPVPDPKATRFNFTAEGGGAVEWWFTRHHALSVGYEFHHTSNAATGDVNPGLNSMMLTLGLTQRQR